MHLSAGSAEKLSRHPPADRLRHFLFDEYAVPHDIIFSNSPRRPETGSQWVPISFLRQACPLSQPFPISMCFAFPTIDYGTEPPEYVGLDIFAPAVVLEVRGYEMVP